MPSPTIVKSYRIRDGATVFVYDDGTQTTVHHQIPVDESGNVITGGSGGSGGAVTIADGADTALGTTTDASTANTAIGLLKALKNALTGSLAVTGAFWQAVQPVSGTFWQAKQPVSLADGDNIVQGTTTDTASSNTIFGVLKAIKNAVTGTLTAAITGTVTANAGTNLNTSALALETGGNLAGAKTDLDTLASIVASSKAAVKLYDSSGNPLFTPGNEGLVNRSDRAITGNLTASGQAISINTSGMATIYFFYNGTFNGSLITEGFDGINWVALPGYILQSTQYTATYNPLVSQFSGTNNSSRTIISCAGYSQVRVRCTAFTSGSAAVILNAAAGQSLYVPRALVGYSGNVLDIDGNGALLEDLKYVNGTLVDTNSGGKSAGTQRLVLATDQPQLTNALLVAGKSGGSLQDNPSDAQAATNLLADAPMQFNGTNWDRTYNNFPSVVSLPSAARTVATLTPTFNCCNCRGLLITLGLFSGTSPSLQIQVVLGGAQIVLTTAVTVAGILYSYLLYPTGSITGTSYTQVFNTPVYGSAQLQVMPGNANAITYALSASLIS